MITDEKGRVVLDSNLLVVSLLDSLLKKKLINITTYKRAIKEVETSGRNKR